MRKEIIIVYQDCPTCGARKEWGEKTIAEILQSGGTFRKVSFASMEGQAHCAKAIEQGVTRFPFVTDGKTYAMNVSSILQAESTAHGAKKKAKRSNKKQKEAKNGDNSEN